MRNCVNSRGQVKRPFTRFFICSSLIVGFVISISFVSSTSASRGENTGMSGRLIGSAMWNSSPLLLPETIETLATDCATPKVLYVLGETVCAEVNGAPLPFFGFRQRRFQWVTPSGSVVQLTDITTDPQNDSYTIPTTGPFSEVGTWTVRTIKNNGSTVAIARFVVRDPLNLRVDLSIGKFGKFEVKSGTNTSYFISVANRGPDDAQNVSLTDDVPLNMSFVAVTQPTGPAFSCATPPVGGVGTITCTIGTLPAGATATFNFTFEVAAGTPFGTTILNTATISNSITELNAADNTSTAAVTVIGAGGGGGDCILSCPADVTVVAPNNASGAIVTYDPPVATGTACGSVSCSPESGTFFPIGTTLVTCQGEVGEPCNFNVTVEDAQNPTITCPMNVTGNEDSPGSGFGTITFPTPTASDNSGFVTVSCDYESPSSFPVGTTTVTCTARDQSNNTASCSFTVTVNGTGCALTCPADIVVTAPAGSCNAVVNFSPTANTECGMVTSSPASGTAFPIGTTTVMVTGTGRSCTFNVTVLDDQDPVITSCPASITVDATSGSCSATVNPGVATATDSCSSVVVTGIRGDGEPVTNLNYPVGTTTITWTATDASGNAATCQQFITVRDFVPPTIESVIVPTEVAIVDADVDCHALIPDVTPYVTASDNCTPSQGLFISQSPAADTVVGAGVHVITIIVHDGDPSGPHNTAMTTTTFTVNDVTPPVLTVNGANPLTVECHTSLVDPGATATDTCVANPMVTSTNNVNVNVPGNYTITYSTTDGPNTVTATRDVIVEDTIAPVITVDGPNPLTVECHTSFTDPGATAHDSCAGDFAATASGAVDVNTPGSYTITYNASDPSRNAAVAVTRTVNVVDTIAPTITMTGLLINLWPPNHSYRTVYLTDLVASASDGCDGGVDINSVVISKVTSDELENGTGDGNTLNDIVIAANCKSVQLRAERDGGGDGRVYTIHFRVKDASNNVTTVTAQVKVPKNQSAGGGAIDSGVRYTVNGTCP